MSFWFRVEVYIPRTMEGEGGVKVNFLAVLIRAANGEEVPDHLCATRKDFQFLRSLGGKKRESRRIAVVGR